MIPTEIKRPDIVRYNSLVALLCAMWQTTEDELIQSSMGGFDVDGGEHEIPMSEIVEGLQEIGCYGFTSDDDKIHLWVSQNADTLDVVHLVGHEIGHLLGPHHEDDEAEEAKAEYYGLCAAMAHQISKGLSDETR